MSKQSETQELHKTIWKIANSLRGAVDGWDFKAYVLGTLFYRYISEHITNYINTNQRAVKDPNHDWSNYNYCDETDEKAEEIKSGIIKTLGYFIPPSQLFSNVVKHARSDENLNIRINDILKGIQDSSIGCDSETAFQGLFDDFDTTSNKLGGTVAERNEKLVALLEGIAEMNLSLDKENATDAFGDAYEYLMGMYASQAGKSGGEYFTPQEVSELLVKLAMHGKDRINKIYDPACGSGSLLLKALKVIDKDKIDDGFFGQEKNITTKNLATINMFLHDIDYKKFGIALGDTLINPSSEHWKKQPFDVIVSNPPYSISWEGNKNPTLKTDPRFAPAGVLAPNSKADLAFVMHCLYWLAEGGTASIVCFPGVMYRGGAEQKIRKYLVDNNFVDAVIQLPDKLFFGTSISTCILILKKGKQDNSVLFIDASKEFVKITNSNMLSEENIEHILQTYVDRKDKEYMAKVVSQEKIEEEEYNLSVSTYVEKEDTRPKIDIKELNKELAEIVKREDELRKKIDEIVAEIEGMGL